MKLNGILRKDKCLYECCDQRSEDSVITGCGASFQVVRSGFLRSVSIQKSKYPPAVPLIRTSIGMERKSKKITLNGLYLSH